jgi:hypothetical protein
VYGSEGTVAGMDCYTLLLCVAIFSILFFNQVINYHQSSFFGLLLNVEGMQRAGVRGHFTINLYCPCQRAMNLQIALNPA